MNHIGQITIELLIGFCSINCYKNIRKTQISQLTPFDFISAIVLGELVGNSIYDPKIKSVVYFIFSICMGNFNLYNRSDNAKIRGTRRFLKDILQLLFVMERLIVNN